MNLISREASFREARRGVPPFTFVLVRDRSRFRIFHAIVATATIVLLSVPSTGLAGAPALRSDVRLGGCGGVYFLAEPGGCWVEIE